MSRTIFRVLRAFAVCATVAAFSACTRTVEPAPQAKFSVFVNGQPSALPMEQSAINKLRFNSGTSTSLSSRDFIFRGFSP